MSQSLGNAQFNLVDSLNRTTLLSIPRKSYATGLTDILKSNYAACLSSFFFWLFHSLPLSLSKLMFIKMCQNFGK
ncbi:hypothetical protein CICLE_v10029737mg [Citrus x clementina]|uniref:Uncharacterized protein n=1 Tax=Citrus clementina TaxID=85681 RepID=V4SFF9_CITCL|nr:hypothetical protein CICLE_v10029737mg [Citrus x clementina]